MNFLNSTNSIILAEVDDSKVTPGAIGAIVTGLLCVATFLLLRNFYKRLRRLRKDQ
ncbi:MAG: hypothetical protein WCJ91_02745 [Actinomycetes bacterium]